jgi:hypothetical protein
VSNGSLTVFCQARAEDAVKQAMREQGSVAAAYAARPVTVWASGFGQWGLLGGQTHHFKVK